MIRWKLQKLVYVFFHRQKSSKWRFLFLSNTFFSMLSCIELIPISRMEQHMIIIPFIFSKFIVFLFKFWFQNIVKYMYYRSNTRLEYQLIIRRTYGRRTSWKNWWIIDINFGMETTKWTKHECSHWCLRKSWGKRTMLYYWESDQSENLSWLFIIIFW